MPLVSVIVPARDAAATLRQAVQSALNGTYRAIELIIVDNGSRDSTGEIAAELARDDDRVIVHSEAKSGVSAAMNAGLAVARGDYLARLDSDDLWHPAKLEKQVNLAIADPELAFIHSFVRYIDDEGYVIRDAPPQQFPRWALCRGTYESLVGANSSALMRRSVVADLGGYDETLSSWEDLLLQLRISARHPIGHVPEYLVGYRVRAGSLSSDPQNMLANWRTAHRRVEQLLPQVPRQVLDWAHGKRCAGFAEGFAWCGRYGACAALLAEAMRHDPTWTMRFLAHRLARSARRRFSPPPSDADRPDFLQCRTDERVGASLSEGRLEKLERKRVELLTRIDRSLARPRVEASDGR